VGVPLLLFKAACPCIRAPGLRGGNILYSTVRVHLWRSELFTVIGWRRLGRRLLWPLQGLPRSHRSRRGPGRLVESWWFGIKKGSTTSPDRMCFYLPKSHDQAATKRPIEDVQMGPGGHRTGRMRRKVLSFWMLSQRGCGRP
jgi:hypothetical protein